MREPKINIDIIIVIITVTSSMASSTASINASLSSTDELLDQYNLTQNNATQLHVAAISSEK